MNEEWVFRGQYRQMVAASWITLLRVGRNIELHLRSHRSDVCYRFTLPGRD
jgi:hypothetical protein